MANQVFHYSNTGISSGQRFYLKDEVSGLYLNKLNLFSDSTIEANNLVYNTGNQIVSGIKIFGENNSITESSGSHILGGYGNEIKNSYHSLVAGGLNNLVSGDHSSVGVGYNNDIYGNSSIIDGGYGNAIYANNSYILNGKNNTIGKIYSPLSSTFETSENNTIINGSGNNTESDGSIILFGNRNAITGRSNIVLGGNNNRFEGYVPGADLYQERNCIINSDFNLVGARSSLIIGGGNNKIFSHNQIIQENIFYNAIISSQRSEIKQEDDGGGVDAINRNTIIGGQRHQISGAMDNVIIGGYSGVSNHNSAMILCDSQIRPHLSKGEHTCSLDFASGVYLRLPEFTGSSSQIGNIGELKVSGSGLYICTGINLWGRTFISTF